MRIHKYKIIIAFCLSLFWINDVIAVNVSSVEFFASNNTKEIDLETAYKRLTGKEQANLQNSMITTLQQNHIEQGKFEDILGTYRMSNDQKMTADNTEHFVGSPYQSLTDKKIFNLAKELAVTLKQDSVAVFIPNQNKVGNVTVTFTSHQPDINEVVNLLHQNLPALYNQAYSLRLANECGDFTHAKVTSVEWLGSKINTGLIKQTFPLEDVHYRYGNVYLVYANGHKEQL